MSVSNFAELHAHKGHNVEIATYGRWDGDDIGSEDVNVAIECTDCSTVLLDFDKPEPKQLGHTHICPSPGCYRRLQFVDICSRCGGQTVPEDGDWSCCENSS